MGKKSNKQTKNRRETKNFVKASCLATSKREISEKKNKKKTFYVSFNSAIYSLEICFSSLYFVSTIVRKKAFDFESRLKGKLGKKCYVRRQTTCVS